MVMIIFVINIRLKKFKKKITIILVQISTWTYGKWYDHDIDQTKGCTSVYMRHLHEKVLTF